MASSLVKLQKSLCRCHTARQIHTSLCYSRRKKPPARDMSKRNLQGAALEERLKRRADDIERQKPYKEALQSVVQCFRLELEELERIKHDTQGELMKREQAEREQAVKNLSIIAKSNEDMQRQREIENLIREDEIERAEIERQKEIQLQLQKRNEFNTRLVLQAIEDSKDFVTIENLEEKIADLLDNEVSFNYAITPDGKKLHSTKPPGNLGDWKGASPSAYIMGGIKPGSSEWNFIFRKELTGYDKEELD